jgi:hypothetical protein
MNRTFALSLSLLAACSGQISTGQATDQLAVKQHDQTTLDATYSAAGQSLHLLSIETSDKVVDITYDFGANVVAYRLDYGAGEGDFTSSGQPFDAAQIVLVGQMLKALPSILPSQASQYTNVENAAMRQTSFMLEAPVGEVIASYHFVSERGWTYINCGCSNQYDGHDGYHVGGVGCGCTGGSGNGCKGRCGGGCQQDGASINAYTRDCLCHDYNKCSWFTASDDFAFAASNCGESYGCY